MKNKKRNWFSKYIFQDIIDMILIPPVYKDGKLLYLRGTRQYPCTVTTRLLEGATEEQEDKLDNKAVNKPSDIDTFDKMGYIFRPDDDLEYVRFSERPITRKEADDMLKRILKAIKNLEEKIDKLCPKE